MKLHSSLLLVAAALLAAPAGASAQAPAPAGEIRVWFTGTSNVRSFTCRATEVGASDRLPSVAPNDMAADTAARPVTLRIPVARVDCGIPLMNRHLRHALHADRHPVIQFTLAEYELVPGDSGWAVRMTGALAIAGVERAVTVDAAVRTDSAGVVHVTGAHPLRVTDYGIQPPRRFAGLLRVREQVTVHFDVPLAEPARPGARAALPREQGWSRTLRQEPSRCAGMALVYASIGSIYACRRCSGQRASECWLSPEAVPASRPATLMCSSTLASESRSAMRMRSWLVRRADQDRARAATCSSTRRNLRATKTT